MKRITISFKYDNTVALITETKGKKTKVLKKVKINNSSYYKENKNLDYSEIIKKLEQEIGKDLKKLNVYIVMPDNLTDVMYVDTTDYTGKKDKDLPDHINNLLKDKRISYIGESRDNKISQIIYSNTKDIRDFTKEIYKTNINVVEMLSHYTALHNSIPAFNGETFSGGNKTRILVDLGLRRTSLILMVNNLPVYIKSSENNLASSFDKLKTIYGNIEFRDFMRALNRVDLNEKIEDNKIYISESSLGNFTNRLFNDEDYEDKETSDEDTETNEETKEEEVSETLIKEVSAEIQSLLQLLGPEIREIYDYASEKYFGDSIEIIGTNSLIDDYIKGNFSSFNVNNISLVKNINTDRSEFELTYKNELGIDSILTIGSVMESLKKGADYYE